MAKRTDRNIIYSFIKSAIDDAQQYLRQAYNYAFALDDIPNAVDQCLRAISAIREAEEHKTVSSDIVSTRQKRRFDKEIEHLRQCQWNLTKEISKKTKSCYIQHEQTSVLRMQFLAYSYKPQDDVKSTEADLAGLYY